MESRSFHDIRHESKFVEKSKEKGLKNAIMDDIIYLILKVNKYNKSDIQKEDKFLTEKELIRFWFDNKLILKNNLYTIYDHLESLIMCYSLSPCPHIDSTIRKIILSDFDKGINNLRLGNLCKLFGNHSNASLFDLSLLNLGLYSFHKTIYTEQIRNYSEIKNNPNFSEFLNHPVTSHSLKKIFVNDELINVDSLKKLPSLSSLTSTLKENIITEGKVSIKRNGLYYMQNECFICHRGCRVNIYGLYDMCTNEFCSVKSTIPVHSVIAKVENEDNEIIIKDVNNSIFWLSISLNRVMENVSDNKLLYEFKRRKLDKIRIKRKSRSKFLSRRILRKRNKANRKKTLRSFKL